MYLLVCFTSSKLDSRYIKMIFKRKILFFYFILGSVVHNNAGPSIVISFALAGIASLLSALCYAEFGAR